MKLTKREQFIADCDQQIAVNEIRNDEVRLSQARSLNDRAEEYMRTHGTDYTTALREVVKLSESGAAEPSVAEVERYMKDNDVEDFGVAVRQVARARGMVQEPVDNSTVGGGPSRGDEEDELKRAMQRRGYEVD